MARSFRILSAACAIVGPMACQPPARSPSTASVPTERTAEQRAKDEAPVPVAVPGRERVRLDRGFRFALGHASDPAKDFGHGTSYFSYLAKAGYGDGPADPNFDDRAFREVDLPHDWAVELPFDEKAGHSHGYKALGRAFPENSVGWYRRQFEISEADRERRTVLEFDGVYRDARVFVNGFMVAHEPSGYASFRADVSDYLNYGGKNLLAVRVDATKEEGWFYEGAGIYRHVWLTKTAPVHVAHDGTFVTSTVKGGSAAVRARARIVNDGKRGADTEARFTIVAPDGTAVAHVSGGKVALFRGAEEEFVADLTVVTPALWSLESPSLYSLVTQVVADGVEVDRHVTHFGIRTFSFDPDRGFFLNGKRVFLKGTNNHQDHAGVGTALPDRLQEFRIERLKAMGSNAYRASHHPPTPELLDACDRLGMLVIDETRSLGSSERELDELERMIRRDRNHPSVILWSLGNEEWAVENDERGARIAASMQALARRLDPTRPTTVASSGNWNAGVSTVAEVMGYNYIKHGSTDEHHQKFPWQPGVGTEETTTQGTRGIVFTDAARAHSAPVANGLSGGNAELGLKHYASREYLAGLFYWTGFDYRGESYPFCFPAISSEFFILDTCGFPKGTFHYLSAWWRPEPQLVLSPHWTFPGREGQAIDVRAYSNAAEVELFLNGKSLGKKPLERYGHAAWKVPYEPGVLIARGFTGGAAPLETTVETTTAPKELRLAADRTTITADGRDVAVVTVSAVDEKGRSVPTADAPVTFDVLGGGRILGVGNGDPSSHEPDRSFAKVTTLPFVDFQESPAPNGRKFRGTLTAPVLPAGSTVLLLLRHFGASATVSLNGQPIATTAMSADGSLPSVPLPSDFVRPGRSVLEVVATPYANDALRERAQKVPAAMLRVESAPPTWSRRLFNGLAQVIVQSTDDAGTMRLVATSPGLARAEVAVVTVAPRSAQPVSPRER